MLKSMFKVVVVVLVYVLAGCAWFDHQSVDVVKSDNDPRAYRYLVLPNQMKVLLVSDPETKKSAAAMDVSVGSRHDPVDRAGLAHFLEHMLFLGTEKYPDASEYNEFLTAHGGSHNAYTAFENTNYFFDVESTQLEPMLDRFSQFFVAPLFTAKYVNREKNAVHSEYMARIRDDNRRQYDVLREVVNPQHPFSKFSVGSLQTLADRGDKTVRDDLLKFYDQHYSANRMSLVVLGSESLDQLQAMVSSRFAAVENRNRPFEPVTEVLIGDAQKGQLVQMQSLKQSRSLDILWPLPDQRANYRSKAVSTIASILGHEGEGSLLSWLKKEGLAERLSAGQGVSWNGGTSLSLGVDLTEQGAKQWPRVVEAIYQTIALLQKAGPQEKLFTEERMLAEQRFRFMEQDEPISYVSALAGNLQDYPAEDVIRGAYRQDQYNPALISELIAQLTPDNAITTLVTPEFKGDRTSRYYRTSYRVSELPSAMRSAWASSALNPQIRLPSANPFVAENLAVYPDKKPQLVPQLRIEQPGLSLWQRQSAEFPLPKGEMYVSLFNPAVDASPRQLVLSELLVSIINDQLAEFSYPAYLAGLSYSVAVGDQGLSIGIGGYNDKQQVLLSRVLDAYAEPHFDAARFELLKADLLRGLSNFDKQSPYQLVMRRLPQLLAEHDWTEAELLAALQNVSLQDVKQHHQLLRQSVYARVLLNGNYDQAQTDVLAEVIKSRVLNQTKPLSAPQKTVVKLPPVAKRFAVASAYDDAALAVYLQVDSLDRKRRAAMGVSLQLLKTDFFTRLRTEQQLGYIVMAMPYPQYDVPGAVFLVQSPVADTTKLDVAINAFFQQWRDKPAAQITADFERYRSALIEMLAEKPKNLGEQTQLFWSDLNQGYEQFNSRELLIRELQAMTFEQWYANFQQDVLNNPQRLAVYVTGKQRDAHPSGAITTLELQRKTPGWRFPEAHTQR